MSIYFILAFICAYLIGSVSSAIIVCRLFGLPDPRTEGSGNPGATNVLRLGGKKLAGLVFLGDALKGLIPVRMGKLMIGVPWVVTTTALFAFLGHLYPVFFKFMGGKGVATYIGCLWGGYIWLGVIATIAWLLSAAVSRISSLSALVMAIVIPIAGYFFLGGLASLPLLIMSVLLFYRHRGNIINLVHGEESKIGQ